MTEQEIIIDRKAVHKKIEELKEEIKMLERKLECGYQKECPHPKSMAREQWGQYLPCETICGLCNKVLEE
jgi:hypothetical protein